MEILFLVAHWSSSQFSLAFKETYLGVVRICRPLNPLCDSTSSLEAFTQQPTLVSFKYWFWYFVPGFQNQSLCSHVQNIEMVRCQSNLKLCFLIWTLYKLSYSALPDNFITIHDPCNPRRQVCCLPKHTLHLLQIVQSTWNILLLSFNSTHNSRFCISTIRTIIANLKGKWLLLHWTPTVLTHLENNHIVTYYLSSVAYLNLLNVLVMVWHPC